MLPPLTVPVDAPIPVTAQYVGPTPPRRCELQMLELSAACDVVYVDTVISGVKEKHLCTCNGD